MNPLSTNTYSTTKTPTIGIFIVASTLLHAGLIAVSVPPHAIPATPHNSAALNVTIDDRSRNVVSLAREAVYVSTQSHQQVKSASMSHTAHTVARSKKTVKLETQTNAPTSDIQQQPTSRADSYSAPASAPTIAASQATSALRTETPVSPTIESTTDSPLNVIAHEIVSIMKTFRRFPPLARQRGWEGEVLLSFRLNQLGVIDNIQVAHGSGFAILDQNAVDTLRRVGNIETSAAWLPRNAVDVSLPVIYKLAEG